jgi:hypothetical protein
MVFCVSLVGLTGLKRSVFCPVRLKGGSIKKELIARSGRLD